MGELPAEGDGWPKRPKAPSLTPVSRNRRRGCVRALFVLPAEVPFSVILGLAPGIQLPFGFYLCFYIFCVNFLGKADFTFKRFFRQGAGGGLPTRAA